MGDGIVDSNRVSPYVRWFDRPVGTNHDEVSAGRYRRYVGRFDQYRVPTQAGWHHSSLATWHVLIDSLVRHAN
jgi:hypothetical protein